MNISVAKSLGFNLLNAIVMAPSQSVDVQYPITWFENHPDSRPILSITLVCKDLLSARTALRKGILDNNIDLDVAKSFLYYFGRTIRSRLDDDWKSYRMVIGLAGAEISPLDLVTVKIEEKIKETLTTTSVTPEDDGWMAGFVLAIYRLTKATVRDYKLQIANRVSAQLKAIKGTAPEITEVVDIYKGWTGDKGYKYNILIAACTSTSFRSIH